MNKEIIRETAQQSLAGTITFPKVVEKLIDAGVESYHVDLLRGENRYYTPNGESHIEVLSFEHPQAEKDFSASQVEAAIRESQRGQIKYQEFVRKIMAAGTVYYIAYLSGKKVIYFGRNGEFHTEPFPGSKSV